MNSIFDYGTPNLVGQGGPVGFGGSITPPVNTGATPLSFGDYSQKFLPPDVTKSLNPTVSAPSIAGAVTPEAGGIDWGDRNGFGKMMWNKDGSFNMNSIGSIVDTVGAFGQLYAGFQANKLAKESLNFQKNAYATNLANQKKSYNLSLTDRMNARYKQTGGSDADRDAYIAKHSL